MGNKVNQSETKPAVWVGVVREMFDAVMAAHRREGLDENQAREIARTSVLAVCFIVGGQVTYFPMASTVKRMLRDEEIYRRNQEGATVRQLIREFRLSHTAIYEALARARRSRLTETTGTGEDYPG